MILTITDDDLIQAASAKDSVSARIIRGAAYFLLHTIGDIQEEGDPIVPTGTKTGETAPVPTPPAPPVPAPSSPSTPTSVAPPAPPPPPPTDMSNGGDDDSDDETEGTNTGNVPTPPPPPSGTSSVNTAAGSSSAPLAGSAAGAATSAGVVSVEVDSAGMPWDERIHQKGKSKKKDLTWKLKKGVDMALVQSVTAELAARRAAAPAPTAGSLPLAAPPTGSTSVPVPPVPPNAPVAGVSAPNNVGSSVPVPPAPAVGAVGSSDALTPYRKLIDKITELTKAGKITPAKVSEICTSHGSPSLMALKGFEALIPGVDKDIDAAALGLL